MSVDVKIIASLTTRVYDLSNGVIMLVISFAFLWQLFGWSAVFGLATVPLMAPASALVAKFIYCKRKRPCYAMVRRYLTLFV